MKKLLFMLLIPFVMFAQEKVDIVDPYANDGSTYADSQSDTLLAFTVYYDTLQVMFSFNDSVDVDVYYDFSNGGTNWSTDGKLMDIVSTAALDTSLQHSSTEPHFYGRYRLVFNSSDNGTTSATYFGWIKRFKITPVNY